VGRKRVSLRGKGADLFFGDYTPPADEQDTLQEDTATPSSQTPQAANGSTTQSSDESASQLTSQSTKRSTNKSLNQSTNRPAAKPTSSTSPATQVSSRIVDRPKAFYITERLDRRLDEAVQYFQRTHGIKKVDRSILINAMLDNDAQWSDKSLDSLVDRVISQLTSRLTGR
jgi:hypothetical protein